MHQSTGDFYGEASCINKAWAYPVRATLKKIGICIMNLVQALNY